jgi:hypothetical protein
MDEIFGLPQALTGNELVTIHQEQNGQLAKCSMPLSELSSIINFNAWIASLPTQKPASPGLPWIDGGVVSVS